MISLAVNMTSEKDALNGEFTSQHYTGKDNIDQIAQYIDYCGTYCCLWKSRLSCNHLPV